MEITSIFLLALGFFGLSMAAPNKICNGMSESSNGVDDESLDPLLKNQIEILVLQKYPEYYKKIKDLPCFNQELKKLEYLVDPLWNQILNHEESELEETTLSPLCDVTEIDPIIRYQLENLLDREYPDYYKTIKQQPCPNESLKKLEYLVDPLWDQITSHEESEIEETTPSPICAVTEIDPIIKYQLEKLIKSKYPDYYKIIKMEPCPNNSLKKLKYLVDPLWNQAPIDSKAPR